jgi:hypothetical protein
VTRVLIGAAAATSCVMLTLAAPAGATGAGAAPARSACRPLTDRKAKLHTEASRRAVTLDQLMALVRGGKDAYVLDAGQLRTLQGAKAGIAALDDEVQSKCYTSADAFIADASKLFVDYRVYWLRVPQTHVLDAANRLAQVRAKLGDVASKLSTRVGTNAAAKAALDAMAAQLATADAKLGVAPTPAPAISTAAGLQPAANMTSDTAALLGARANLVAARAALGAAAHDARQAVSALRG